MARLERMEAILDKLDEHHSRGVTFGQPSAHLATTVTIAFSRWVEMNYPSQIRVIIEPY